MEISSYVRFFIKLEVEGKYCDASNIFRLRKYKVNFQRLQL